MKKHLLAVALCLLFIQSCLGIRCKKCLVDYCPEEPTDCERGLVKDFCQCCLICAKGEGENCGGTLGTYGVCAQGLGCSLLPPSKDRVQRLWHNLGVCKAKRNQ